MTLKRGLIYGAIIFGLIVGWFILRRRDQTRNTQIKSVELAPENAAKVIVDPANHSIVTVTRSATGETKTSSTFLPPSGASVELRKNGSVLVTAPKWGTELNPFLGLSLGSDLVGRAALGLNLFYIQRWELGGGLVGGSIHDLRLFAHVSYNVYANYFVSLGIDHKQTAMLTAGIKF